MAGYYDVVLGLIPLSLVGLTALLSTTGLPLSVAAALASTVAVGLMCHAMFVNAPAVGTAGTDGPVADPAAADPATAGADGPAADPAAAGDDFAAD